MSARIRYADESLGTLSVVRDVLPSPEELVFREEGVKITIALSKRSVEFFKRQAEKRNTQYQRMIRRVLDAYAEHHTRPRAAPPPARAAGRRPLQARRPGQASTRKRLSRA